MPGDKPKRYTGSRNHLNQMFYYMVKECIIIAIVQAFIDMTTSTLLLCLVSIYRTQITLLLHDILNKFYNSN